MVIEKNDDRLVRLGSAIRARRVEQHISQRKLAQMIGNSENHSYIGRVERGELAPRVDVLFRIADALGMQMKELFDF